jgi:Tfp pilus assembly PilM family ATPase/Tfp pilus assembly protein PilN
MAGRVGIELTGSRCTLIQVQPSRRPAATGSRVSAFRSLSYDAANPASLTAALRELRASKRFAHRARVVLWGVRSAHHVMRLPPTSAADLDTIAQGEARRVLPILQEGEFATDVWTAARRGTEREVVFAAASAPDVHERLGPILEAGFSVSAVLTPPIALAALDQFRAATTPDLVAAYVAVNRETTCLAIVRRGVLLFSREIPGAFGAAGGADRGEATTRLATELKRSFLFFSQRGPERDSRVGTPEAGERLDIQQIILCGDCPDLRALTAPLIYALDIDVETLDSLEGFDAQALPEPASEFRDHVAEMRLAWVAAAVAQPPVNLLPSQARARQEARRFVRTLAAGLAAALAFVLILYGAVRAWNAEAVRRTGELRRQIATLEPEVLRLGRAQAQAARAAAVRASLEAFNSQGPRLARVAEDLARSAPRDIVFESIDASTDAMAWQVTVTGFAIGTRPVAAQESLNQFLRLAGESRYLGPPVRPATIRVASSDRRLPRATEGQARPPSGALLEFEVAFEVRK